MERRGRDIGQDQEEGGGGGEVETAAAAATTTTTTVAKNMDCHISGGYKEETKYIFVNTTLYCINVPGVRRLLHEKKNRFER